MSPEKPKSLTVALTALGCPKNIVDSERMLAEIAQAGFIITADPENADVVVINTCGFIEPAKIEALEAIKHAVDCKRRGAVKKVIVAGCLPQRLGHRLLEQAHGIDAIVGLGHRDAIARIIERIIHSDKSEAFVDGPWGKSDDPFAKPAARRLPVADDRTRLLITPGHWTYLRISEGCNRQCSFCTVPAIRGPFRSKPEELVLAEAAELVSAGVVELNIIAQDTTYYGRDLKMPSALVVLLKKLEKIPNLRWIRLMYLYPAGVTDRLIEAIAKSEKIVRYLDIPIQHADNKILRHMHRPDTSQSIRRLIERLRSALPDCLLRTTLIVGFPGETERQFNELLEFVRWAQFDALGCFKFSPESGTLAAEMPAQVPDRIKQQRVDELMLTQQEIAFAKNINRVGATLTCLVDSVRTEGLAKGRFYGQAPDIDSLCLIKNCSARPGQFINANVVATRDYDLIVEQV